MPIRRDELNVGVSQQAQSLLLDLPPELVLAVPYSVASSDATNIMGILSRTCRLAYSFFKPELEKRAVAKALHHAAYARAEDVKVLLAMVNANPRLLFQKGNVITPGGLDVRGVTIFEFLLGAGDPELAAQVVGTVAPFFDSEQKNELMKQYKKYLPCIHNMMRQEPDLTPLFEIIKRASSEDVAAMLYKDLTRESELKDAMCQFRKDHAPGFFDGKEPRMHYNYDTLKAAYELLDREWDNLRGDGYNKIKLVARQIIGFLMRRFSGVDRCEAAQGQDSRLNRQEPLMRTYEYRDTPGEFPVTCKDDSLDGLGGDYLLNMHWGGRPGDSAWENHVSCSGPFTEVSKFISNKKFMLIELIELIQPRPKKKQRRECIIC